jgi:exosortase H (IPTLxxWG-CTERM-specific)
MAYKKRGQDGVSVSAWWQSKHPVLRFVALLFVYMIVWKVFFSTDLAQRTVFQPHLRLYARVCAQVLRWLGEPAMAADTIVSSPRFSVTIAEDCDAIQPIGLFVSAVLASPVGWRRRIAGLLVGPPLLTVVNVVRIVILFYIGIHFPRLFEVMHRDVSQGLFILVVLVTWVIWALWAVRRQRPLGGPPRAIPVAA